MLSRSILGARVGFFIGKYDKADILQNHRKIYSKSLKRWICMYFTLTEISTYNNYI